MNARPLCERWRTTAAQLRRYGADDQAAAVERCAAELEQAEREYLYEELTIEQAATEAGIAYDTMSRKVRDGAVPCSRHLADSWLRKAEELAGLESQDGSLWHAYRRAWATARKHLPAIDVARAGGWKGVETLQAVYENLPSRPPKPS